MVLEVLGTGCAKCKQLHAMVVKVVEESGVQAEILKVEDLPSILERGVLSTPALVKDGRVLVAGRIPSAKEVASWLAT
ncbi:MAG TPA: thioredoxin family protein [Fibrobacteria bacterium]|nr:thioredoxin family protein [Fibrobacteria bacterium]